MISNKITAIVWKPWAGKTALSTILIWIWVKSWDYKRVYTNYEIKWIPKNVKYTKLKWKTDLDELENLDINAKIPPKGILVLDEAGRNLSSRNYNSIINKMFSSFLMISRKANLDIIWIAQRFGSVDVNYRALVEYMWKPKIWQKDWKTNINAILYKNKMELDDKLNLKPIKKIKIKDISKTFRDIWVKYNTRDVANLEDLFQKKVEIKKDLKLKKK